jgi:AraC-like DNA-binding protein
MDRTLMASPPWALTDEPLLWLVNSGDEVVTPKVRYSHDASRRPDPHLCLTAVIAGEGFHERGGQPARLLPGMFFFEALPGDFRYGYPPRGTAPFEFVWLDLVGPAAEALRKRVVEKAGPVFDLGVDNPVAPLMRAIVHQLASGLVQDRYQLSVRVYEVLMLVLSLLDRARLTTSPLVQGAVQLIHERGTRAATDIGSIAAQLRCTREHLGRAFAGAVGLSPGAYLLQHRLRRAQEELRGTADGIDEVARRCGFSGANYFCRIFREKIGLTPHEFRSRPWVIRGGAAGGDDPASHRRGR